MRPIFSEYAADDQSDGAVDSMNSTELVSYGRELGLVGGPPALSERAIKKLFAFCSKCTASSWKQTPRSPRFKQAMLKTPERLKVLWLERCQRLKEKEEAEAETVWWGLKWNECEILFFFVRYSIYILSFIFLFGWIFVPLEGQAAANHRD